MNDLVWYACYGSNMHYERFKYYILGGLYPINNREYKGCKDKTLPRDNRPVIIPFELYYAKSSSSWGGGVAFVDFNKKGKTLGRMYLITKEQFREIQEQEGSWYSDSREIGQADGHDIMTFSNDERLAYNAPSQKYLDVMKKGMEETYPSK